MYGLKILMVESNLLFAEEVSHAAADIDCIASFDRALSCAEGVAEAGRLQPDLILVDSALIEPYCLGASHGERAKGKVPKLVVMANTTNLAELSEARLACADVYVCREEMASLLPAIVHELCWSGEREAMSRAAARPAMRTQCKEQMLSAC
jgi:DNA-binding NarL/FixJ family response regulator